MTDGYTHTYTIESIGIDPRHVHYECSSKPKPPTWKPDGSHAFDWELTEHSLSIHSTKDCVCFVHRWRIRGAR